MNDLARKSSDAKVEVTGYVEGWLNEEVVGWAWKQGSTDRLRIDLRCGRDTVSSTIADVVRDDLRLNGVGDGCHAFRLIVPNELRGAGVKLAAVAVDIDGSETILSQPPVDEQYQMDGADVRRNLQLLVGSQRVIHRNLQAALLKQGPSLAEGMAQISSTQAKLGETLATLELFTIRVEDLLRSQLQVSRPSQSPTLLMSCAALSSLACLLACLALWRVMALS